MDIEEVLSFVRKEVLEKTRQPLTIAQEGLIRYCYCEEDKTYDDMEEPFYGYKVGYIKTQLAPRLWESLTQVLGKKITRKTLKSVLQEIINQAKTVDGVEQVIQNRYRVTKVINKSEFGKICLAEDLDLDNQICMLKQVVCKRNDEVTRNRLNKEITFLYQLNWHRQIPGYIAHFEDKESFYIVYKYVEGEALSDKLPEEKLSQPWSQDKVITLLVNVLNVLEFVHKRGMVHRDVRPSNLIESPKGEIYLINFGLIKNLCDLQTRTFTGTIGYSAPEQLSGMPKFRSDIYAVAMVAIQALTGVPPKDFKVDFDRGRIIWQPEAQVSPELARIIDKMAEFNWENRYQSATEILKELKALNL